MFRQTRNNEQFTYNKHQIRNFSKFMYIQKSFIEVF